MRGTERSRWHNCDLVVTDISQVLIVLAVATWLCCMRIGVERSAPASCRLRWRPTQSCRAKATGTGGQPVALAARRRRHEEPATTPAGMSAWAINVSVRRPYVVLVAGAFGQHRHRVSVVVDVSGGVHPHPVLQAAHPALLEPPVVGREHQAVVLVEPVRRRPRSSPIASRSHGPTAGSSATAVRTRRGPGGDPGQAPVSGPGCGRDPGEGSGPSPGRPRFATGHRIQRGRGGVVGGGDHAPHLVPDRRVLGLALDEEPGRDEHLDYRCRRVRGVHVTGRIGGSGLAVMHDQCDPLAPLGTDPDGGRDGFGRTVDDRNGRLTGSGGGNRPRGRRSRRRRGVLVDRRLGRCDRGRRPRRRRRQCDRGRRGESQVSPGSRGRPTASGRRR